MTFGIEKSVKVVIDDVLAQVRVEQRRVDVAGAEPLGLLVADDRFAVV